MEVIAIYVDIGYKSIVSVCALFGLAFSMRNHFSLKTVKAQTDGIISMVAKNSKATGTAEGINVGIEQERQRDVSAKLD